MNEIISFFSEIPVVLRTLILLGGVVFFWILEGIIPFYSLIYKKTKHAILNLLFTITTAIIGFGFAFILLKSTEIVNTYEIGFIHLFNLPLYLEVIICLLLLDLVGAYLVHFVEHKVPWMWKFHVVHHSDENVDVTTGLRHHPGETVFRILFTILGIYVSGASIGIVMLYQSISVLFAHITHANVGLPHSLDKAISYIFVTPNMHKVHHHFQLPLTDKNYGNIFSIWDRIFGTYHSVNNSKSIIYGIDTHMKDKKVNSFYDLFLIPFQKMKKINKSKFS
jgi:sterol desaturase/sphingolipid hydroxylase (fatty acid hydroxylase superfamily)